MSCFAGFSRFSVGRIKTMALPSQAQLGLSLNKFLSVMEEAALKLLEPLKLAGKKVKAQVLSGFLARVKELELSTS